jgi:hypothetical protein
MLLDHIMGYRITQAIYVAAKLGIADQIQTGPRSAAAIAEALAVPEDSVHRVLRALTSAGIFRETDEKLFALTAAGSLLCSDSSDSLRAAAIFFGDHRHWTLWSKLLDAVTTGRPVRRHDDDAFAQRAAADPEGAAIFNSAMSALTAPVHAGVLTAYDFGRLGTIVDIGGGHGALLASILARYVSLRGVLFDIPAVIEGAKARIETVGLESRCRLEEGDFFKAVPSGGDAYILKWIIHDWDDERSRSILSTCRAAMADGAKLLIIERVLPNRADIEAAPALAPAFADLNMMVLTPGRERTEAEYQKLLEATRFRITKLIPTGPPFPHTIIEADCA